MRRSLANKARESHLPQMDAVGPVARLNAALDGRYRIERELGEGGMATVYLADDLKHERKVALKVLKPELAAVVGAERFLAEIKTTANLQHPHILPLFDSGEAGDFLFYVMPYVQGESLRQRLDREHQLPVEDAVRIVTNMAEALDYAHRQGVIHRDIKPANVLLQDGRPVIADFGIALAVTAAGGGRLTETGLSLGTPHYMSPEQATGDQTVGHQSDVYALGCVLYEMLVGEPPYTGSTAQAILGKIITQEPPSALDTRKSVPPHVDAAVRRALEKLPADRFASAQDFARALSDAAFRHGKVVGSGAVTSDGPWKPLTIALAVTTVILGGLLVQSRPEDESEPTAFLERYEVPFRESQIPADASPGSFALSADGSMLIYTRSSEGSGQQLWIRRWAVPDATPLRGTERASQPAVSLDGRELAFVQDGLIKVMPTAGGPARTLTAASWPQWGPDGAIYATREGGIVRISSTDGAVEEVMAPAASAAEPRISALLPNGERALVTVAGQVVLLDLDDGRTQELTEGNDARYVWTGHVVFSRGGQLFGAMFDARSVELGPPEPLGISNYWGWSVSESGKLFYQRALSRGPHALVRVDRPGRAEEVEQGWEIEAVSNYTTVALSPDGDRLAVVLLDGSDAFTGPYNLWVHDLTTGLRQKLTTTDHLNTRPSWTPDGRSLLFLSFRDGVDELWRIPADGGGEAQRVVGNASQGEYSPDGEWIVYRVGTTSFGGQTDIRLRRAEDEGDGVPILAAGYSEWDPAISPDGQWLAYSSDRSGRFEVYVRAFPDVSTSARVQVSMNGGTEPRWARGTNELFFRDSGGQMVSAGFQVSPDGAYVPLRATPLFDAGPYLSSAGVHSYDVSADGQTFYMFLSRIGGAFPRSVLVNNLGHALRRRLPN
ncbi:MAG: protein kinase [Gemmatimonadetes bacterium]|nr:protein kinase [Gemmatimonadota bacterium]